MVNDSRRGAWWGEESPSRRELSEDQDNMVTVTQISTCMIRASSTVKLCLYNHIKYLGHLPREMNILKSVEKDRNLAVWAGS